jgi:CheY-like chemotaxis protein
MVKQHLRNHQTEQKRMTMQDATGRRASLGRYVLRLVRRGAGRAPGPAEDGQPEHRKSIVLVDDDPIILKTTSRKLDAAGYEVTTAADSAEALNAVAQGKPEFILLDINFPPDVANAGAPVWDGFRLMYWLKSLENTQGTRYIMISGSNSPAYWERAQSAGAVAFFAKPIDHQRLLWVLQQEAAPHTPHFPRRWWAALFSFL